MVRLFLFCIFLDSDPEMTVILPWIVLPKTGEAAAAGGEETGEGAERAVGEMSPAKPDKTS